MSELLQGAKNEFKNFNGFQVMKVDIEGFEYGVFQNIIEGTTYDERSKISQIAYEHHRLGHHSNG